MTDLQKQAAEVVGRPAVHFVGFRGDEYVSARRVWGVPDFFHLGWDRRACREIDFDADTIVFARGPADQPFGSRNFDDVREDNPHARDNEEMSDGR